MLTEDIKQSINECVLCWLATADADGFPNCSPKEAFTCQGEDTVVIANIASPISVRNIQSNPLVCVSFVDVFKQKGFKLKGTASYLPPEAPTYAQYAALLSPIIGDAFPVKGVIVITVSKATPIIAPSYYMISGTTEASQIEQSRKTYGV